MCKTFRQISISPASTSKRRADGDASDRSVRRAVVGRRILGIDPGSLVTGWGIVESFGNSLSHVACGTIATAGAQAQGARLSRIYRGIQQIIVRHHPDGVSLEKVSLRATCRAPSNSDRRAAWPCWRLQKTNSMSTSTVPMRSSRLWSAWPRDQGASAKWSRRCSMFRRR